MKGSSNALLTTASARLQDFEYLCASNTNVSNFVSVKLSGNSNYLLWKAQMLCLLDSNNMCGIVDPAFSGPRDCGTETMRQYNSLVKGWIFGSVTEDILVDLMDLGSANAVWEKLKSMCDPTTCLQEAADVVSTTTVEEAGSSIQIIVPKEAETKNEDTEKNGNKVQQKKNLREAIMNGNWPKVESILKQDKDLATEAIDSDGSTILHIAVGRGFNDIVKNLFPYINDEQVLKKNVSDGTTALHIAAIVGNTRAAELLVKKNSKLLQIGDDKGEEPLHKAYGYMHLDTIGYLLKEVKNGPKLESPSSLAAGSVEPDDKIAVDLLVNAISAKQYRLASELVQKFPQFASKNDEVLMAIARTFPSELNDWETLIYPSWHNILVLMAKAAFASVISLLLIFFQIYVFISTKGKTCRNYFDFFLQVVFLAVQSAFFFICFLILIIYFPFPVLYSLLWKGSKIFVPPIKQIHNKKKEWDEAKKVLEQVCNAIDSTGTRHLNYTGPILEAACHNAYQVVDEILGRSSDVIQSTDENGYDIIQLAIIHRSERIYNLIYDIGERKNLYRTFKDPSDNNILHLAGRLAPSNVLNQRTGAALQLQRELQWREEVKKLVFPTYITQWNKSKETPDMVFTREHEELVKEGEQWMKTTAESCSITAALITTIVFAAAITVPGGNDQEGTPVFKNEIAFIFFAVSNAISLFASSTALLVFLSILTARFAEKDFQVSLPRRLFIGLFSLLLSTVSMMVAFSATLVLVFCKQKPWMLAPICGLAFIPIASFVTLQSPLMVDLFKSTFLPTFGKQRESTLRRFNPDEIRLHFGK